MKIFGKVLLCLMALVVIALAAGAATLDDVAKSIQQLQIGQARLEAQVEGLRTITTTLFVALFAAIAGLFYFVLDISRSLRVPKEERVSKLEAFMEKAKDHIREIDEKLHLPKSILVFFLAFSILLALSANAAINIQGALI